MGMTVNGDKSYTVRCGPMKQNRTYFAKDEPIKFVTSMRDLGVQFAQDGNYRDQIEVARAKASRKSNWILCVFTNRSPDFFRIIWKALVQPHLDFPSPVWAPTYQKTSP